jgi:hypothetical protein
MGTTTIQKLSNTNSKTKSVTVDYIKIPKDFKSLHELKDLVNNYDLVTRLSQALNGYQRMYLDSYLMTYDDVLRFIPESQHSVYDVQIRGKDSDYLMRSYIGEKKKGADKYGYARNSLSSVLLNVDVTKNDKAFLVNAEDKKVDVCFWFDSAAVNARALENKQQQNAAKYGLYGGPKRHYADVVYNGKMDFSLDSITRMLVIYAHYSYGAKQAVGGVWINGGNGYLSGHSYTDYTINGYDIYHFCTRTNKYMGYKGFQEDPQRGWMDIKRRY